MCPRRLKVTLKNLHVLDKKANIAALKHILAFTFIS